MKNGKSIRVSTSIDLHFLINYDLCDYVEVNYIRRIISTLLVSIPSLKINK